MDVAAMADPMGPIRGHPVGVGASARSHPQVDRAIVRGDAPLIMTVSEAGRACFDGQGNRLARDRDEPSDRCLDDVGLEASGIGPLQGERARFAALSGGWTTGFDPEMDGTWSGLPLIGRTNWSS